MAASIFTGLSNLSPILHTQTDADSPINQTLKDGIRYFLEGLTILGYSTGNTGAVTTITETVLTDSGETWTVDEHINRTLVITSGLAIGNMYQIDDNTADTLTCTGETMVSDGVAISDNFEIFFDLLNNTDGHDHDGVNSSLVNLSGIMSLPIMAQDETALTETGVSSWTSITGTNFYIRVPENATTLHMSARFRSSANTPQIRFNIGGNVSSATSGNTGYGWYADCSEYDCSALSEGDYQLRIMMTVDPGTNTAYLQGFHFWWE